MKCRSMSASRYNTYNDCEFQYFLQYELGLLKEKNWAAENGSLIHRIFEEVALAKKRGVKFPEIFKNWFVRLVDAYRHTQKIKGKFGEEEEIPPLWTLSDKAISREKACSTCKYFDGKKCFITNKHIDKFPGCPYWEFETSVQLVEMVMDSKGEINPWNKEILAIEQMFNFSVQIEENKVNLIGFIDLVSKVDNETVCVEDYKTGRSTKNYDACMKDIQMHIYHMAARKLYPDYKYIFVMLHWLQRKSGRSPVMVFHPNDIEETKKKLIDCKQIIEANNFPVRRCDTPSGFVKFDYVCQYFCNPNVCQVEYQKFLGVKGDFPDDQLLECNEKM